MIGLMRMHLIVTGVGDVASVFSTATRPVVTRKPAFFKAVSGTERVFICKLYHKYVFNANN
jgi:hypothetical protein